MEGRAHSIVVVHAGGRRWLTDLVVENGGHGRKGVLVLFPRQLKVQGGGEVLRMAGRGRRLGRSDGRRRVDRIRTSQAGIAVVLRLVDQRLLELLLMQQQLVRRRLRVELDRIDMHYFPLLISKIGRAHV